jgi:2',3'-cyclic-nucleotide 2'-phosphodiesterase (5'-nucleotidase family)
MKRTVWIVAILLLVAIAIALGVVLLSRLGDGPQAAESTPVVTEPASVGVGTASVTIGPTAPAEPAVAEPASTETIILLHTNDFHGAIEPDGTRGGLVNLVSLIDQLRAQDPGRTLVLDAGDTFQGTYVSNSTYGEVVMAAMNLARYQAWALGNHEFDWGQEPLRARIAQAGFPALAANVLDANTGELWDAVEPYTVVQAGQAAVAILGLTYPDTPVINKPQNVAGLDFRSAEETVRSCLPELEAQSDLVVVLSHLGHDGDLALAQAVDGIDVIIGGHSHIYLERPKVVNDTIILQAGAKGQVLGRLELTVDLATGEVVDYTRLGVLQPVRDGGAEVNQEVKALVDEALAEAAETMDQPIGETAVVLEPRRAGEFALGNLVVDAMLATDVDGQPADIAMHNNGGIRASLPKGPITYGQLYAVLPFDNQLMALDLTGAQILRILEHSVAERAGAMQVAGLTFRFNMSKPVGQRVLEATAGGEPLDPERVYRVVTIDYIAAGGDGQETFLEGTNAAYGDTEVWAVAEYIRAHSPVHPRVEGRIQGR